MSIETIPIKEFLIKEGYKHDLDRLMPLIESGDKRELSAAFDEIRYDDPTGLRFPTEVIVAACFDNTMRVAIQEVTDDALRLQDRLRETERSVHAWQVVSTILAAVAIGLIVLLIRSLTA